MNIIRTKTTALLTHVLGPAGGPEIHQILKITHFSRIADETTNLTTKKFMVIVPLYYSVEHKKSLEKFHAMPEVDYCIAPGLKKVLDAVMDHAGIPPPPNKQKNKQNKHDRFPSSKRACLAFIQVLVYC